MMTSKHLKGQLDPPVSNVTFFGPKEVSWTPLLVTVTFFGPEEVSWTPSNVMFFGQKKELQKCVAEVLR